MQEKLKGQTKKSPPAKIAQAVRSDGGHEGTLGAGDRKTPSKQLTKPPKAPFVSFVSAPCRDIPTLRTGLSYLPKKKPTLSRVGGGTVDYVRRRLGGGGLLVGLPFQEIARLASKKFAQPFKVFLTQMFPTSIINIRNSLRLYVGGLGNLLQAQRTIRMVSHQNRKSGLNCHCIHVNKYKLKTTLSQIKRIKIANIAIYC